MKKLVFSFIAMLALTGMPALAAPITAKDPPPAARRADSWTGFYIGGNVGYGWTNANSGLAGNGSLMSLGAFPASLGFADSNAAKSNGVLGGAQAGYNYQISRYGVLGLETDFQYFRQRASNQFADPFSTPVCSFVLVPGTCLAFTPVNGTALTNYQAKIDWFGTVRGRVGATVGDQLLVYGTGGLAYGGVSLSGSTNINATWPGIGTFSPATAASTSSKVNIGFSVGGGMEGKLSYWLPPNWSWKLEYLYLDLGSLNTVIPYVMGPPVFIHVTPINGNITIHTHFTDSILRVGLNYKFDN